MIQYDISFLKNTSDMVEIPLTITGKSEGANTVVQQFISTLCADNDKTREFGGDLLSSLRGANLSTEFVEDTINIAATSTVDYLALKGVPIATAELTALSIIDNTVSVSLSLFINDEDVELNLQIPITE